MKKRILNIGNSQLSTPLDFYPVKFLLFNKVFYLLGPIAYYFFIAYFILSPGSGINCFAQCNRIDNECAPDLHPYISDGQYYHAKLSGNETAEFKTTFYANETYKIVACGEQGLGDIQYKLFDANYNMIFDNADFENAATWEFKFSSTDDFYIQAKLLDGVATGCAVLLIGFDCHCGD